MKLKTLSRIINSFIPLSLLQSLRQIFLQSFFGLLALAPSAHALTGGEFTVESRFAAVVNLQTVFEGHEFAERCTGTFITSRHILTAAHCFTKKNLKPDLLRISAFPSDEFSVFTATFVQSGDVRFHLHPEFVKNPGAGSRYDVAIAELRFPSRVVPMELAKSRPAPGAEILLTGYGCDKKMKQSSTPFKTGKVILKSSDDFLRPIKSGVAMCIGDSGAPGLMNTSDGLKIVGVNSYYNVVSGMFGSTRDRLVPVDRSRPEIRNWLDAITARQSYYGSTP